MSKALAAICDGATNGNVAFPECDDKDYWREAARAALRELEPRNDR